jgi:hypothetical protein
MFFLKLKGIYEKRLKKVQADVYTPSQRLGRDPARGVRGIKYATDYPQQRHGRWLW